MRIELQSSLLAWADYCSAEQRLRLGLRDGKVYDYFMVPEPILHQLLAAESHGGYFNQHIRNEFTFRPVKQSAAT